METKIIGQDALLSTLNSIIDNPPHIYLTGPHGCGKTTVAKDFIRTYFLNHKVDPTDPNYIMELSSEKDRGMATVRTKLADFTREAPIVSGIYRWVLIDDADTLPVMSQQALRRPMEQYSHLTRFFFITSKPQNPMKFDYSFDLNMNHNFAAGAISIIPLRAMWPLSFVRVSK